MMSATMMALSAIGLLVPAVFHWVTAGRSRAEEGLSVEISVVLFVTYCFSLIFALKTHKDLYLGTSAEHNESVLMKPKTAVGVLVGATALVAWMSELLVHAVEGASHSLGMTEVFIGVIVVAVIGNAAEHSTAVLMAMKNQMDLAYHIAVGSSMQIALFVAPVAGLRELCDRQADESSLHHLRSDNGWTWRAGSLSRGSRRGVKLDGRGTPAGGLSDLRDGILFYAG
jgi:Ca2+:H+ antiporter